MLLVTWFEFRSVFVTGAGVSFRVAGARAGVEACVGYSERPLVEDIDWAVDPVEIFAFQLAFS